MCLATAQASAQSRTRKSFQSQPRNRLPGSYRNTRSRSVLRSRRVDRVPRSRRLSGETQAPAPQDGIRTLHKLMPGQDVVSFGDPAEERRPCRLPSSHLTDACSHCWLWTCLTRGAIYSGSSFRAKYLVTKATHCFLIHNDNGRKYQHFELLYAKIHPRAAWLRRSYSSRLADLTRLSEKFSGRSVSTDPAGFGEFGAHTATDEKGNPPFRGARINNVPFFKLYCHRQIPPHILS
jgi:hypothetical protein